MLNIKDYQEEITKLYQEGKIRAIGVSNFKQDHITNLVLFNKIGMGKNRKNWEENL